jgi:DnaJ-class molecular chaperone
MNRDRDNVISALLAKREVYVTLEELACGDTKTFVIFADLWIDGIGCSRGGVERRFHIDFKHVPMNSIIIGQSIIIYGMGHELRCTGASYAGNLLVSIKVAEHPIYHMDMTSMFPYDLSSTIYITLIDFFKGQCFYAIPSPTGKGDAIMVEYNSGKRVCIKYGCGLQGKGDIYYYFDVIMPSSLEERQYTLKMLKEM